MVDVRVRLLTSADPELAALPARVAADPEGLRRVPLYARDDAFARLMRSKHEILGGFGDVAGGGPLGGGGEGASGEGERVSGEGERASGESELLGFFDFTVGAGSSTIAYWVTPAWRRQGVGTALVGTGIEWVHRHLPIRTFRAHVDADNLASRRILEANGFVPASGRRVLPHWVLEL